MADSFHLRSSSGEECTLLVVYGYLTDHSGVGKYGIIVFFHPRGRGPHHGAALVVLPTPRGRSRVGSAIHVMLGLSSGYNGI